jgi:hypothetical protein
MGTLHEAQYMYMIISPILLVTMRNVENKSCIENQNTQVKFKNFSSQIMSFVR